MHLFHVEYGSGVPLVLLHGFPFDHTIWEEVIGEIKKGIRIIAPDLRGHGSSIIEESNYSIVDMASDVIELLDHLQLGQVGIAGHSLGGYIALEIARIFPERVSGLILIASHIYADSLEKKQSRFNTADQIKTRGVQEILADMPKKLTHNKNVRIICQDAVAKMDSNGAIGALHAMANRGSRTCLENTGCSHIGDRRI